MTKLLIENADAALDGPHDCSDCAEAVAVVALTITYDRIPRIEPGYGNRPLAAFTPIDHVNACEQCADTWLQEARNNGWDIAYRVTEVMPDAAQLESFLIDRVERGRMAWSALTALPAEEG